MRLLTLLLFASSLSAQVVHVESESFTAAAPACVATPSTSFPAGCIQNTGDTAPPAVGNQKIILQAGAVFDYSIVVPTAGSYTLAVRLNGVETVYFESPVGWNVTASIVNPGSLATFTGPKTLVLAAGPMSIRMVVDSVGAGYPSANWFELRPVPPAPVNVAISADLKWDDGSPIAGNVQVFEVEGTLPVLLKTLTIDTGHIADTVVFDLTQADPLVLSLVLNDSSGNAVCATPPTPTPKILFTGVTKVIASATLKKSCAVVNWGWGVQ